MTWAVPAPKRNAGNFYNKIFLKSTNNSYVYFGHQKRPFKNVILKYIPLQGHDSQIDNECEIQRQLKYKYVMPLQEIFTLDDTYRVLVMEVAIGSLISGFAENYFKTSLQVYKIMYQITKGVNFLHKNKILHGDIKPSNIVLMNTEEDMPFPRIIDFGHAQTLKEDENGNFYCNCHRLTDDFSAPEVLRLQPHSFPSDIFALGATFYFLITEEKIIPNNISREQRAASIENNFFLSYEKRLGPQFPASGKQLIQSMLNPNPLLRPTANIDRFLFNRKF